MMYEELTCEELKKDGGVLPEQRERWGQSVFLRFGFMTVNVLLAIRTAVVYLLKRKELLLV